MDNNKEIILRSIERLKKEKRLDEETDRKANESLRKFNSSENPYEKEISTILEKEERSEEENKRLKELREMHLRYFNREYVLGGEYTLEEVKEALIKLEIEQYIKKQNNLEIEIEKQNELEKNKEEQILDINKIKEYEDNPFKPYSDEKLKELAKSIQESGLLHPLIILKQNNTYKVLSGHNRLKALKLLGYERLNNDMYKIYEGLSQDEINLIVVNTNLNQRQKLLYSEKAFAYKMQLEAIKKQGKRTDLTSAPLEPKLSTEGIAKENNESREQVKRYIRLTSLITDLLEMVDNKKIKFRIGVEISYLKQNEQQMLLHILESKKTSISLDKATELKKASKDIEERELSMSEINEIVANIEKPKKKKKVEFKLKNIKEYLPRNVSEDDIECTILERLEMVNNLEDENRRLLERIKELELIEKDKEIKILKEQLEESKGDDIL